MRDDALERVLRLVAEGRLTADEAAPILDALDAGVARSDRDTGRARVGPDGGPAGPGSGNGGPAPRFARIEVVESGRKAVDLRVPLSLGRRGLSLLPGLSSAQAAEIDDAVSRGLTGPIVDIQDEDGDGVRIVLE